jgi:hypothetical protein
VGQRHVGFPAKPTPEELPNLIRQAKVKVYPIAKIYLADTGTNDCKPG